MRYRGFNISETEVDGRKLYEVDPILWRERGYEEVPVRDMQYENIAEVLTWVDAIWQTPPKYEADQKTRDAYPDTRPPACRKCGHPELVFDIRQVEAYSEVWDELGDGPIPLPICPMCGRRERGR